MTEFKVGERVRVFDGCLCFESDVLPLPEKSFPGAVCIERDDHPGHSKTKYLAHFKQCRRLRPRAKPEKERSERWVNIYGPGSSGFLEPRAWTEKKLAVAGADNHKGYLRTAHMIEIHSGEVPVSKEALEKAFKKIDLQPELARQQMIGDLCEALGFPKEVP